MHRISCLTILVTVIGCLLATPSQGQGTKFPALAPPDQDSPSASPSSPYTLPRSSAPERPLASQLPSIPPLRQLPSALPQEEVVQASGEAAAEETAADAAPIAADSNGAAAPFSPAAASPLSSPASVLKVSPPTTAATKESRKDAGTTEKNVAGSPLALHLRDLVPSSPADAWSKVVQAWRYELFMGVTVEKLSIALVLLFIGYLAAKRISSWFASRVLGRLGIQRNNVATVQTIAFYALMAAFTLSTLGALGVPVTVFSFFGGALAVGIGFGSQNIVNNFISGLILLAERPIRIGDVIQIDGVTGKVTEIGARSTRVTTGANMEILVPNSTFLQTNVVNWTLSDDIISSKVTVGVAYGSPARQVAKLLEQAAQEHPDVLKEPAPGVSFTNFGDHALEFELSFWLRLSQSDRGRIESDLRFAIDDLFGEHGIIIAYPQRDVHLNLLRPVEVKLTQPLAGQVRGAAA